MTRRQFVGNSAVAMAGFFCTGIGQPGSAMAEENKFIESACENKGKKILVAYDRSFGDKPF